MDNANEKAAVSKSAQFSSTAPIQMDVASAPTGQHNQFSEADPTSFSYTVHDVPYQPPRQGITVIPARQLGSSSQLAARPRTNDRKVRPESATVKPPRPRGRTREQDENIRPKSATTHTWDKSQRTDYEKFGKPRHVRSYIGAAGKPLDTDPAVAMSVGAQLERQKPYPIELYWQNDARSNAMNKRNPPPVSFC